MACARIRKGRMVDLHMKKKIIFALLVVLGWFLCASASAQTFTFDAIHATCEVSDDYILLTPENLAEHPEWVANQGTTVEELLAQRYQRFRRF